MPRQMNPIRSYLLHKKSGQARVRIAGREFLLGPFCSEASRIRYGELVAKCASGVPIDPLAASSNRGMNRGTDATDPGPSIAELIVASSNHVEQHCVKNGEPTSEQWLIRELLALTTAMSDGVPVVLKSVRDEFLNPTDIARLRRELDILSELSAPGIIRAIGLEWHSGRAILVLEDIGGRALNRVLNALPVASSRRLEVAEFLDIAIPVVEALGELHRRDVVHNDIKQHNIVCNSQSRGVKLIDFGLASHLARETQPFVPANRLEGTLAYMSPEQTGRMNRMVDYRSDLYSLGATFYELLAGVTPFQASDPMEFIHAHIAREPRPLTEINDAVPAVLSRIILKLLAKNAEDRYQSAFGLQADLVECRRQWQSRGAIGDFTIGESDVPSRFQIPEKLYGREAEIRSLMTAFDQAAKGGAVLMLVSGEAGTGKSAIVHEVHKPITEKRGFFISGKCDQFRQDIPYEPLILAFQDLIRQLAVGTEEAVSVWKSKLLEALGSNGKVLIDILPELEWLIGPQPPVTDVGPTEATNRFNLLFLRFIGVFTRREHPLTIFLDDLQWADSATLRVLRTLMTSADSRYLFCIGAYRAEEIDPNHPFQRTLDELRRESVEPRRIQLQSLLLEHVAQLVSDATHAPKKLVEELAGLVHARTGGTPFFVNQFLQTLYREKLLEFDASHGCWRWELEAVRSGTGLTDNVVELISRRIRQCPAETQRLLQWGACIGHRFDLTTLAVAAGQSIAATVTGLRHAIFEELIAPVGGDYRWIESAIASAERDVANFEVAELVRVRSGEQQTADDRNRILTNSATSETNLAMDEIAARVSFAFVHDRVQQAAYSLFDAAECWTAHVEIARLLLAQAGQKPTDDQVFEIVSHFNRGCPVIKQVDERDRVARMNLHAGQRSFAAVAYEPAVRFLEAGLSLISDVGHVSNVPASNVSASNVAGASTLETCSTLNAAESREACWTRDYRLSFDLHLAAAEAQAIAGRFDDAKRTMQTVIDHAATDFEKASCYEKYSAVLQSSGRAADALQAVRNGLAILGVPHPATPEERNAATGAFIGDLTQPGTVERFGSLGEMNQTNALIDRLNDRCVISSYFSEPDTMGLVISRGAKHVLDHGVSPASGVALAWFSMLLGMMNNKGLSFEYGELTFWPRACNALVPAMIDSFEFFEVRNDVSIVLLAPGAPKASTTMSTPGGV